MTITTITKKRRVFVDLQADTEEERRAIRDMVAAIAKTPTSALGVRLTIDGILWNGAGPRASRMKKKPTRVPYLSGLSMTVLASPA